MNTLRAAFAVFGAIALANPACAETSSWVMETTEAPKPKRGRPVKLAPAPSAPAGSTFQGPATAGQSAYAKSLALGRVVSHDATTRIADGMACRTPDPGALEIIRRGVDRVIEVTDDEIESAMRAIYEDTHNVAEGAAASTLAALLKDGAQARDRQVAIVLTGANVDASIFARVLTE